MEYNLLAPALALALVLSYILTPQVRALAIKIGAMDYSNPRKVHNGTMPRLGGLAIYLAFVASVLIFRELNPHMFTDLTWLRVLGLLTGTTLIMLVGAVDDIRGLSPRVKMAGQVLAALTIICFDIQVDYITNPLNGELLYLGIFSIPLTVFWVVAVTNAVNLIDGLDGLAGGVASIAALTMAAVAWTQGVMPEMIILALILVAAVVGFLRYNFFPARIFLGDSGSMFLGFTLSVMAIMSLTKGATAFSVIIPLVILGVPLLDTFFAILRRCFMHRPIFQADRQHLHHQLMSMGLTHRQTVLAIYGLSAFLGLNAVVLNLVTSDQALILLIILAVSVIYLADRVGVLGSSRLRRGKATEEYEKRSSKM